MGQTTQGHFRTRLKAFFNWATRLELIDRNPSLGLEPVTPNSKQTVPLSPKQFEELLAACDAYDANESRKIGKELRALFLVMRWSGLRIGDALMLHRFALSGNRLTITTQKTGTPLVAVLPDCAVEALSSLPSKTGIHADYFFWSHACSPATLTSQWNLRIQELNGYLKVRDERGQPMRFHSHMLRDTFAIQLLLVGVPLEDVSRALTHASIRVTEKFYAPWIRARREQLEDKLVAAMRKQGATFAGI